MHKIVKMNGNQIIIFEILNSNVPKNKNSPEKKELLQES